ncbi:FecCD family ABC transporter permease [Parablautia intestinalis]|uniref:FecCD family ABC transporter permease n=1 Tax=Parablautia intestinalis TaxID=2320100 RepID=UPI00256F6010|nr:iron ABC transporter permease [Parablautia intestinalis]
MKSWRIFSTRYSKGIFWSGLVLLLLAATALSLWTGSVALSPARVLDVLTGKDTSSTAARIIFYSRLPRTCAAFLAGAALAVAGMVIQTVLNNPLASPGVIGVNSGAGFAVALVCAVFPAAGQYTPLVALSGALIAALLVTGLSWRTGASRITVVLAGVAISALFGAGIDAVVTLVPEALDGVADFRVGGFTGVTMARLVPAGGLIFVSLAVVLSLARQMDVLRLGSDTAQSLGLCVGVVRFVLLFLAAVLAGAAVSFCGLMGFVGLIIPNTMRRLLGEGSLELTAASALGGAFFVIVCDVLSRILFAPFEIPVGIILAFAGAPFFLWLLLRQKGMRV